LCHVSLLSAAERLRAKNAFDGQLFLVRHLLILREITRNLEPAQKDESTGIGGNGNTDSYGVAGEYCLRILDAGAQMIRMVCQTQYLLFCHAHRLSFLARYSRPLRARVRNTSRMPNEYEVSVFRFTIMPLIPCSSRSCRELIRT